MSPNISTVSARVTSTCDRGSAGLEVYFGLITFTGSLMAFGKLQGFITGAPVTYPGQNFTNVRRSPRPSALDLGDRGAIRNGVEEG